MASKFSRNPTPNKRPAVCIPPPPPLPTPQLPPCEPNNYGILIAFTASNLDPFEFWSTSTSRTLRPQDPPDFTWSDSWEDALYQYNATIILDCGSDPSWFISCEATNKATGTPAGGETTGVPSVNWPNDLLPTHLPGPFNDKLVMLNYAWMVK